MTTKTNPAPKTASVKAENTRKAPGNVKGVTEKPEPRPRKELEEFIPENLRLLNESIKADEEQEACILEHWLPNILSAVQTAELNELFKTVADTERACPMDMLSSSQNAAWIWAATRLAVLRLHKDKSLCLTSDGSEYLLFALCLPFDREYYALPKALSNAICERMKALAGCFNSAFDAIGRAIMAAESNGDTRRNGGDIVYFAKLRSYAEELNLDLRF
jgi:hypothetical protein